MGFLQNLDMNLSFLLGFKVFLMNFGYQIDVFCCFSWHFRGVEDSGENCVRSVFRGGLPERSGEPLHVASLHRNLRVSFLCAWCVVRQRLFKLRVRTQRLPEFDMP